MSPPERFITGQFLDFHKTVNNLFRTWRTARNIYIDRDYAVNTLHNAVSIENTSAGGTSTNSNHPFRFGHLYVDFTQYRSHFLRNGSHHHQQIALPGRKA